MNNREKHIFSDKYNDRKDRLLSALDAQDEKETYGVSGPHVRVGVLVAAVLLAVLALSVSAAVAVARMNMTKTGGKTTVTASVGDNETGEKPLRAWNPTGDEVAVRLDLGWLPDDMPEDETATYKFGSTESGRWMTLSGYDLRRGDMNRNVTDTTDAEGFTAGGHQAYIVKMSEIYDHNKVYVMFEEDDLVINGYVGKGVGDDEIKKIVGGMTLCETTDVREALPVDAYTDGQFDVHPVTLSGDVVTVIGEQVKDSRNRFTMTVDAINVLYSLDGIDMADCRMDQIEPFVDENRELTEYPRTEAIHEDGIDGISHFGETKYVKKCLVTADITYTSTEMLPGYVYVMDSRIFGENKDYRIGETRRVSNFSEPVYVSGSGKSGSESPLVKEIGAGETITFTLGWLVDEDWLSKASVDIFPGYSQIIARYSVVGGEIDKSEKLPVFTGISFESKLLNSNRMKYLSEGDLFRNFRQSYTLSIDSVRVAHDMSGIDMNDCNTELLRDFIDVEGNFVEFDRMEVIYTNGINAVAHYGETVKAKKLLVTADFTYTNTGKNDSYVWVLDSHLEYADHTKSYMFPDGKGFSHTSIPVYVSGSGGSNGNGMYSRKIAAGETVMFTLGWLLDEDLTDFSVIDITSGKYSSCARYVLNNIDK